MRQKLAICYVWIWRGDRFSWGPNCRAKNRTFPIKNKFKFSSARCIGTIYYNVRVLTDVWKKKKSYEEYHRFMQECLTSQNKFIDNIFYNLDCVEQNYYFYYYSLLFYLYYYSLYYNNITVNTIFVITQLYFTGMNL